MKIRRVEPSDRAEWLRVRAALWADYDESQFPAETAEILADADGHAVFVIERDDGRLGGFAEIAIRGQAVGCETTGVGYLEGWYVDADLRQGGLGRKLLEAGEAWARSKGCREMASDADIHNAASLAAHAACGFREATRQVNFKKEL